MSNNFAFVIRHAHKSDCGTLADRESISKDYDCHITDVGHVQAFKVGETLGNEMPGAKLLFLVSPFQRCLQTVEQIINGLQNRAEVVNGVIYVEDALRENHRPGRYEPGDFDRLHFFESKSSLIHMPTVYNSHPIFEGHNHHKQPFPESPEIIDKRAKFVLAKLSEFMQKEENKGVTPVLVTHCWMVKRIAKIVLDAQIGKSLFCSTTKLNLDEKSGQLRIEYLNRKMY